MLGVEPRALHMLDKWIPSSHTSNWRARISGSGWSSLKAFLGSLHFILSEWMRGPCQPQKDTLPLSKIVQSWDYLVLASLPCCLIGNKAGLALPGRNQGTLHLLLSCVVFRTQVKWYILLKHLLIPVFRNQVLSLPHPCSFDDTLCTGSQFLSSPAQLCCLHDLPLHSTVKFMVSSSSYLVCILGRLDVFVLWVMEWWNEHVALNCRQSFSRCWTISLSWTKGELGETLFPTSFGRFCFVLGFDFVFCVLERLLLFPPACTLGFERQGVAEVLLLATFSLHSVAKAIDHSGCDCPPITGSVTSLSCGLSILENRLRLGYFKPCLSIISEHLNWVVWFQTCKPEEKKI